MTPTFHIHPIGKVHKKEDQVWIDIDPRFKDALLGLDGFSHVVVLFWCHRNDTPELRGTLQVHPRKDPRNPLTGVFATHSPLRPNPIATTLCRLMRREGLRLYLETIDAWDDSPVIDIKCYIPDRLNPDDLRLPQWV